MDTAADFAKLQETLKACAREVDATLESVLPKPADLQARVQEAARYSTLSGGKRLRPFLVMQSAQLFGVKPEYSRRVGAAVEMLHSYSLVHDDLPCMDDDDLRRGRPTTHKAFDEATAVLAGDALLTQAFEVLADPGTHPSAEIRCRLVTHLAQSSGTFGMIGGQMIDMEAEKRTLEPDEIRLLQRLKTGALFEFCCAAGVILGEGSKTDHDNLLSYARDFGLAFQITDDLLDALGDAEKAGKAVGKDAGQGKATLIGAYGIEGARAEAERLAKHAADTLAPYGDKARALRALPFSLLDRQS